MVIERRVQNGSLFSSSVNLLKQDCVKYNIAKKYQPASS